MSAAPLTKAICDKIKSVAPDFICLNYANADMVGHTGDFRAAQKACEIVDQYLGQLISTAVEHGYELIVIADHGNSDIMINEDGSPHTAHTTNLVPVIYISDDHKGARISDGKLADIAPTILTLMGIDPHVDMDGVSLIH